MEQDFGHFFDINVNHVGQDEDGLKHEDCVKVFGTETCNDDMTGLDAIYWFILIFIVAIALLSKTIFFFEQEFFPIN